MRKFARNISLSADFLIDALSRTPSLASMLHGRYHPMLSDAAQFPALWRIVLGLASVLLLVALWTFLLVGLWAVWSGQAFADAAMGLFSVDEPDAGQLVFILLLVGGLTPATLVAARFWQKRSPRSLIGPGVRSLRHFAVAAFVTAATLGTVSFVSLAFLDAPMRTEISVTTWLSWLPIAVGALLVQTGGEELLFRGYLQSQIAARFNRETLAVLVPSILFGLAHYAPNLPPLAALTYVVIATVFGILAADLTLRTGSLGAACGLHFANNSISILVISPDATLGSLALWSADSERTADALTSPLATLDIVALLVLWFLIRRALRV